MEQKKKHPHSGHRQRLKKKAIGAGIEHWPYHEVLELLLTYAIPQKDVNPLAHELINTFGSFAGVLDAGYEQLIKIKGISESSALFLTMLPEFFLKYTASKNVGSIILDTSYNMANYFRSIDRVRDKEVFYIFCLNSEKKLIKTFKFDSDMISAVGVPIAEFSQKIAFPANKSIVIMHTHPSGDTNPTDSDIEATKRMINIAMMMGVKIDDHVIVANNKYFSFNDNGMIQLYVDEIMKK